MAKQTTLTNRGPVFLQVRMELNIDSPPILHASCILLVVLVPIYSVSPEQVI